MDEEEIRIAVFLWLKERGQKNGGIYTWVELTREFSFKQRRIPLVGVSGIWTPAEHGFSFPISIRTSVDSPYEDTTNDEGFLLYAYFGKDPQSLPNRRLRDAGALRIPLVYFEAIEEGKYQAVWPVVVIDDHPEKLMFRVAVEPAYLGHGPLDPLTLSNSGDDGSAFGVRRYATAVARQRLHQAAFRERVLGAYSRQCAMCRLQHAELLDAAHIVPDGEDGGEPIVQNGLSLCKIHHAAYDQNILGVTPDYQIRVRQDILEEVDGPMLKYGLQAMDKKELVLPRKKSDYPDPNRLERRYNLFAS
jgi:putative restriction endonuclease